MYQGKFSNNQQGRSTSELLAERAAKSKAAPQEAPVSPIPEDPIDLLRPNREQPDFDPVEVPEELLRRSAPAQNGMPQHRPAPTQNGMPQHRPASAQNGMPQHRPAPAQNGMPQHRPAPAQNGMPQHRPAQKPAQGGMPPHRPAPNQGTRPVSKPVSQPRPVPQPMQEDTVKHHTKIFYTWYFGFIFVFFVITFLGLLWLRGWLTDYEAAQPGTAAEAFFQMYFEDPNWGLIYDNAVNKNTVGERAAYVAYMENKVEGSQLTYQETSAGLSGNKKYFVKLGNDRVASFILEGDSEHITDSNWKLGDIEIIVKHEGSYRIQMLEGHTAYVNGEKLDESYTIMKASTAAQDYLPVGTTGIRMWIQEVDNLIGKPEVKIVDEKGQQMEVEYDSETMTFLEKSAATTMTEEQEEAIIGAAKVYGEYMINRASRAELAKRFDASSTTYTSIRDQEKIVQESFYQDHSFGEPTITDFTMYSEDLFSAHIAIKLNVTIKDGTIKEFPIDNTMFFAKQSTGKWLVYDMTNQDVQKPIGKVRLTFMNGDQVISSDFYDTNATELDTPMISVPEGKVFSGWVRKSVSNDGKTTLTVVFPPSETGHVTLPSGTTLEPMVLTPLFENANSEGGAE